MTDSVLKGQAALVVGGGSGIGRAVALSLAEAGCRVGVAGRRSEPLQQTCREAGATSAIQWQQVDVARHESAIELVEWFETAIGPPEIMVNAAGINIKTRSMAEMTPDQWEQVMAINATGAYHLLSAVLPSMRARKEGTIIQISSVAGKRALTLGGIAYCASKFAMTALGTAVGEEESAHGIRITNVCPGEVDTPLLEARPTPATAEHRARMLQPEDVAQMVVAICRLPPRAHVPEIVIKPHKQPYC
jgi:NADP-dependent 3-hydroxy acid dehydrogenase YdfG